MKFTERLFRKYRLTVRLDVLDSSVTLSEGLFNRLRLMDGKRDKAEAFVFRIPESGEYAFMIDAALPEGSPKSMIQYNGKHKTVGFQAISPTVARILHDYGVHPLSATLRVQRRELPDGKPYYVMLKPEEA